MKNQEHWQPTKYVAVNGGLRGSRNPKHVAVSSRLICDLLAQHLGRGLKEHATGRLLDLGCGNVPLFGFYRNLVDSVVCVDWANTLHFNEYLDFECDLSKPLPFPDQEFDTIVLSDVLEHIPQPQNLFNEAARILSSQGKLIITVPFIYWIHEQPFDFYRYTEFALRRFAEVSGMRVVELTSIGGAVEVITDIFAKNAIDIPVIGSPIAVLSQSIVRSFVLTRFGGRVSRRSSASFPFGYFMVAAKN